MGSPSAAQVELFLVFGAVLAFGFWELYSLRRDKKRTEETRKRTSQTGRDGDDASGNGRGAGD
jgi:hypothetical protein